MIRTRHPVDEADEALARLRDAPGWSAWVPGLLESEMHRGAVRLQFGGPRPFELAVEVTPLPDGVRWAMQEGELQECRGEARVEDGWVVIQLSVEFPIVVPGLLRQSVEKEWVPALAGAVNSPSQRRS